MSTPRTNLGAAPVCLPLVLMLETQQTNFKLEQPRKPHNRNTGHASGGDRRGVLDLSINSESRSLVSHDLLPFHARQTHPTGKQHNMCTLLTHAEWHAGERDVISRVLYPFADLTRQDGARSDSWAGQLCMAYFGHRPILYLGERATERQTFNQPAKSSA